jgi:uncharacterized protein YjbJ (UPF0337 family)
MNSDIVAGKWKQWKSQMWLMWADMFDSDCSWLAGSNDLLSGVLQEDYGREKDRVSSGFTSIH